MLQLGLHIGAQYIAVAFIQLSHTSSMRSKYVYEQLSELVQRNVDSERQYYTIYGNSDSPQHRYLPPSNLHTHRLSRLRLTGEGGISGGGSGGISGSGGGISVGGGGIGVGGDSTLILLTVVVLGVSVLCITSLIVAGVCWYRLYKQRKSTEAVDYKGYGPPAGGTSSVSRSDSGDRKLAQSAQMYHYQHHKQQMMALDKLVSVLYVLLLCRITADSIYLTPLCVVMSAAVVAVSFSLCRPELRLFTFLVWRRVVGEG